MGNEQNYFHFTIWFDENMIDCEETHSFIHRFYDKIKKKMPENYGEAQQVAREIFAEMQEEYFGGHPKC